jgi:hypothetical protein
MFNRFFKKPKTTEKTGGVWPFDQPENCAVITTTHVLKEGKDITRVSHDLDDHGWQFHQGGGMQTSDAMVVLLKNIVAHDPTVLEVADMPPGWVAVRTHRGAPWRKQKNEG